jgi:hypothetical protein
LGPKVNQPEVSRDSPCAFCPLKYRATAIDQKLVADETQLTQSLRSPSGLQQKQTLGSSLGHLLLLTDPLWVIPFFFFF